MSRTKALIMEGNNGVSFFLQQTLMSDSLVDQVNLAGRAEEAIALLNRDNEYRLVVINLLETPEEGMQLGFWLSQQPDKKWPVILIVSTEDELALPLLYQRSHPFVILPASASLSDFSHAARLALNAETQTKLRGL